MSKSAKEFYKQHYGVNVEQHGVIGANSIAFAEAYAKQQNEQLKEDRIKDGIAIAYQKSENKQLREGLKTLKHRMDNGLIQCRVKDAELVDKLLKLKEDEKTKKE